MSTLAKIFDNSIHSYTYNDLIVHPTYIDFSIDDIDLTSVLTPTITLKTPFISSPMDTVTGHELAIQLALQGGLGIIHNNNTPEMQKQEVMHVKRYNNGFINNPITFSPETPIKILIDARVKYGFSSFPITDSSNHLLGSISKRDIDFIDDSDDMKAENVMTKREDLVIESIDCSLEKAQNILKETKRSKLFVVDDDNKLISLICRKDILNSRNYPLATKDARSQLQVGAAISTRLTDRERLEHLVKGNVDIICIDSSQGNSIYQLETIKYIKATYPDLPVIAGNVVTHDQANNLIACGADILRVGMGVGSICTTQEVCGIGRGQCSAIYDTTRYTAKPVPIIADGGIQNTGNIIKAFVMGSSAVMMGSLFAGTDEACNETYFENGIRLKKYRGMGSLDVMKSRDETASRYFAKSDDIVRVAQGVSGSVVSKGSVANYVPYLVKGVKHGFQDIGIKHLNDIRNSVDTGNIKFEIRSIASMTEGGVHDLYNYVK
jgi:IMP dehydrogenase